MTQIHQEIKKLTATPKVSTTLNRKWIRRRTRTVWRSCRKSQLQYTGWK